MTEQELRQRIEWCEYSALHHRFPEEAKKLAEMYSVSPDCVPIETTYQILVDVKSELIALLDEKIFQLERKQMLASAERTIAGLSSNEPDDHS